MTIPGKMCIGILEEDNPQKSYFRFKPLLALEDGGFIFYEGADQFPENGCLRIVPDKNESSRFKARMRRIGKYCMVDLREHPEENDKIRPNKNYHTDDTETNAYIIYSDVVRELPEGLLIEIVSQEVADDAACMALNIPSPGTARVLLSSCNPLGTLWTHAPMESVDGGLALKRTEEKIDMDAAARFDVPGFGDEVLSFVISRTLTPLYRAPGDIPDAAPEKPAPQAEEAPIQEEAPATDASKPWLHRDESMLPRPVSPNLSPREHALALQTGINPKRGRSLQEIIDDKWRRSRIDQLGHPAPEAVTGNPVISPVDRAVEAVRAAWEHVQARPCIAKAMSRIDGLGDAMLSGAAQLESEERAAQLKAFEQTREQLSMEIATMREDYDSLYRQMNDSMRAQMKDELDQHQARITDLEKLEADINARAEEARAASEQIKRTISELTNEKLTERISEYALNSRAFDIITSLRAAPKRAAADDVQLRRTDSIGLTDLVGRVRIHFASAGFHLSADEAVNLLACMALDGYIVFSGPVGCGKTAYARLLSEALGLDRAGCVFRYKPGAEYGDTPVGLTRIVLADDINTSPNMAIDIMKDFDGRRDTKLLLTCQDSATGAPLDMRLLDRAFMIRLTASEADSPWEKSACANCVPTDEVITSQALRALFPMAGRSAAPQVARAMADLRTRLSGYGVQLSRRALDSMWLYCSAVTPHLSMSPMDAFDLAFAQRALPAILTGAPVEALHALPTLLQDMPRSLNLLSQPLAIEV